MSVIDTSRWKAFKIGDLFDIQKGKRLIKTDMVDGDYPFIGASAVNNGVTAFVGNDACLHDGYCLTVCYNGSVGEAFLQKEPFWASDDVNVLRPFDESVSDFALMFVAPCIRSLRCNYGYTNKWTSAKMAEDVVFLPATPDGEPDWAYMESYMRDVMDREEIFAEHLASLTAEAVADGHVIDTSGWKAFRVGGLFETHAVGKKVACPTGGAIAKARLLGGDTPRVTVSGVDNGIVGYFKDVDDANYRVYKNCISVSFLGTVFYQKKPTSFDMKVHVLQRDDLNEARGLYLASIIRKTIANFDYAAQLSSSMLPDTEIMLPATPDGEPDWAYMEQYMKDVMAVEALFADELDCVYCS